MLILFSTIQSIEIHLRIGYGVSQSSYTKSKSRPFQGGIQDNRAAPVLWLILSILLVKYLYFLQLVPKTYTPISLQDHQLGALLCADNTDLIVRNSREESEEEIHVRA